MDIQIYITSTLFFFFFILLTLPLADRLPMTLLVGYNTHAKKPVIFLKFVSPGTCYMLVRLNLHNVVRKKTTCPVMSDRLTSMHATWIRGHIPVEKKFEQKNK
jgi:hypothetical protein